MENCNLTEAFDFFSTTMNKYIKDFIPNSKPTHKVRNIYMTHDVLKLKKKKAKLWKTYVISKNAADYARYVKTRKDRRKMTRDLRRTFELNLARI